MARTFYDSLGLNEDAVMDLSMLEGTGLVMHDESKSHVKATMHASLGSPLWLALATGHYGLQINPAPMIDTDQYLDAPAADTAALDFTSGDYSLAIWFYWTDSGLSQVIMGKYAVNIRGWEVYITRIVAMDYMTVRHHHAGGATLRTASYSLGWVPNQWHLFSYSRIGTGAQHYRDGQPIATVSDILIDPASSAASDLVIGSRYTHDANWFCGRFHRPRAWARALTADEHRQWYDHGAGWW